MTPSYSTIVASAIKTVLDNRRDYNAPEAIDAINVLMNEAKRVAHFEAEVKALRKAYDNLLTSWAELKERVKECRIGEIGQYTIRPYDQKHIWIQNEAEEGGAFKTVDLIAVIDKFFTERF